jgi:hypothetical protein
MDNERQKDWNNNKTSMFNGRKSKSTLTLRDPVLKEGDNGNLVTLLCGVYKASVTGFQSKREYGGEGRHMPSKVLHNT